MEKINIWRKPRGFGKLFRRIPSYLYRLGITKPFETTTLDLSTKVNLSSDNISVVR